MLLSFSTPLLQFKSLSLPLTLLRRRSSSTMSTRFQPHVFAGNPIRAKTPKSLDPLSPNSALDTLKSVLLSNINEPVSPNFRVLPFRKGRPLAGSGGDPVSSPRWHLGWLSLTECSALLAGSEVKLGEESLVYLGCGEEEDVVYWAIDLSDDIKLVDELGRREFSFVELRTLMVATDWADSLAMGELAIAGHAKALLEWHGSTRFCGQCGSKTVPKEAGRRMQCSNESCKRRVYPRVDPVVINMGILFKLGFLLLLLFPLTKQHNTTTTTTQPLPILPLPTFSQLQWQQREIIMFLHFGPNTFTDSEWGSGHESPSVFVPSALNAAQWASTATAAGISLMILTAKHHDGFCLWPSRYTDHSVARSPWRSGRGDVVREFVTAAGSAGVDAGLYLSPWDRHDRRYGHEVEYNEFYMAQLRELLTRYGSVKEIWFDGAKGANAPNMSYYFQDWFSMVKELQPSINIFSDAGPDIRWVGDETGSAGTTCWSTVNRTSLSIGNASIEGYLKTGDPRGTDWVPPECDISIRPGWFWHPSEVPKNLTELLQVYYNSVGRNCVLLLNVPPNSTGLVSDVDALRLKQLRHAITTIFAVNVAEKHDIRVSSQWGGKGGGFGPENLVDDDHLWTYWAPKETGHDKVYYHWIEIREPGSGLIRFNVVKIQEAIGLGQRVERHEVYVDGRRVANGTTVGHKRLHRLECGVVEAKSVRIRILGTRGLPLISSIGLYLDPYWNPM